MLGAHRRRVRSALASQQIADAWVDSSGFAARPVVGMDRVDEGNFCTKEHHDRRIAPENQDHHSLDDGESVLRPLDGVFELARVWTSER